MAMREDWASIPEFYAGRTLLVTGATGFMGKVLIEKLLRSCPDVRAIYVLLRAKKAAAPAQRLRDLLHQPLFDRLRAQHSEAAIHKVHAVAGDVREIGLGLSAEDRAMLEAEVSVVFHSAASVRFDDPLSTAILVNVRGTRELLLLARRMRQLVALLHLSTTFSNCDRPVVQETLYPAPGDWRVMIRLAEGGVSDDVLRCITPKVTGSLPNTYTYAKALGEHVVNDFRSEVPVAIVRPSIVIAAVTEPYIGWVDNVNGPTGLWVGGYTGVLRCAHAAGESGLDTVPVDTAIRSIISIAWHRALSSQHSAAAPDASSIVDAVSTGAGEVAVDEVADVDVDGEVAVYNCCSMSKRITQHEFIERGKQLAVEAPTLKSVWYPTMRETACWPLFVANLLLLHLLPGYLMDWAMEHAGHKPMFVKLYRRIFVASRALKLFSTRDYHFTNRRFLAVGACVPRADLAAFGFTEIGRGDFATMLEGLKGMRVFLLKDPLSTMPAAKARLRKLYWLDRGVKAVFWIAVLCAVAANTSARAAVMAAVDAAALWR